MSTTTLFIIPFRNPDRPEYNINTKIMISTKFILSHPIINYISKNKKKKELLIKIWYDIFGDKFDYSI